jgi:hypothetical protein
MAASLSGIADPTELHHRVTYTVTTASTGRDLAIDWPVAISCLKMGQRPAPGAVFGQ